ncbi:MAG: glycosyltransferase family 39 protein [Candidatus Obscuribacterales bacterium]|nr:glycosyltransferase family 39 protein [Candidatus Obscuribacterales bacterium]
MKIAEKDSRPTMVSDRVTLPLADEDAPASIDKGAVYVKSLLLILAASAAFYLSLAYFWPKFSRAEVFFAECAREMIVASNYITPLYHGVAFFDKPILCYWLIIGCFKAFGITHFASRLPSIVGSLAVLTITASACRMVFGSRAALISAMILASSFMYLSFSALCMSDIMLVLCDLVTLILLYAGLKSQEPGEGRPANSNSPSRVLLWSLAAAMMGVGFVTKGPVAVVLPAGFFFLYVGVTRQLRTIKPKHFLWGTLALGVIGAPWFFMAYSANGIESMAYFFIRENVQRFAGSTYDTRKPIWFMVVSLLGGFLPWSVFLPSALWASIKQVWNNRKDINVRPESTHLYLLMWTGLLIGFFSMSRGKIDYYALPVFPACAMLTAHHLNRWLATGNRAAWIAISGLNGTLILAGIVLGIFIASLPLPSSVPPLLVTLPPLVVGCIGFWAALKRKVLVAIATIFGGLLLTGGLYTSVAMPVLTKMQPALQYGDLLRTAPKSSSVGIYLGLEHWIDEVTFRSEKEPVKLTSPADLTNFLSTVGSHWLIIKSDEFATLPEDLRSRFVVEERRMFIPKSISPAYILQHREDLTGGSELILARSN